MRAPRKHRSSGRSSAGWFGGDGRRALVACLCLCLVFLIAFGAYVGDWLPLAARSRSAPQAHGDSGLSTGSIVFMPLSGDYCRQRIIDNATWRIRDNGIVKCHAVLLPPAGARAGQPSAGRIDVMRDAFRQR